MKLKAIIVGLIMSVAFSLPVAASTCSELQSAAEGVLQAPNLEDIRSIAQRLDAEGSLCEFRRKAKRELSKSVYQLAVRDLRSGIPPQELEPLLHEAKSIAPVWPVMAALAENAKARGEHELAARLAVEASIDMHFDFGLSGRSAEQVVLSPEQKAAAQHIAVLASQMQSLAPVAIDMPLTRDGQPDGVYSITFRNIVDVPLTLPIEFKFGEANFTAKGEKYAEQLYAFIFVQGLEDVTLVGHTDPIGTAADNERLSLRRAKAVVSYLRQQGLPNSVNITTVGKGESEPIQSDNPELYKGFSEEELHQLNRRVEIELYEDF